MKCLSKTIRNEQHNTELNDVISKDEIEVITNDSKRIKTIKNTSKGFKQESKILRWRLRKLFNVLVKWDVSIVLNIVQCKSKKNVFTVSENNLLLSDWQAFQSIRELHLARTSFPEFCIPMVVLPASISNNIPGTQLSIGSDTALNAIVQVCRLD